jgi:hypothetical protein
MNQQMYEREYLQQQIRDLIWCRRYHLMLVKDIDARLQALSKRYECTITVEEM